MNLFWSGKHNEPCDELDMSFYWIWFRIQYSDHNVRPIVHLQHHRPSVRLKFCLSRSGKQKLAREWESLKSAQSAIHRIIHFPESPWKFSLVRSKTDHPPLSFLVPIDFCRFLLWINKFGWFQQLACLQMQTLWKSGNCVHQQAPPISKREKEMQAKAKSRMRGPCFSKTQL